MKEQQKKHLIEMMQQDEELGLYEEILGKKAHEYSMQYAGTDKYTVSMLAIEFGYHLALEQGRWKTVFEETPPSSIQLLAESPDGVIHLTDWRAGYQIFSCQVKSESSDTWKWKTI